MTARHTAQFLLLGAALSAGCGGHIELASSGGAPGTSGAGASTGVGGTGNSTTGVGGAGNSTTGVGGAGNTATGGAGASSGGGGAGGMTGSGGIVDAGDGPGDTLDPDQVYLLGTLVEGSCGQDALATIANPNAATVGFDCYFDGPTASIRPTDGRLIYTNIFEDKVREFHCDACTYQGVVPDKPLLNDPILSDAPCTGDGFYLLKFLVSPDGVILHTCVQNPLVWYDEAGNTIYDNAGDALVHLGHDGEALTLTRVVNLANKTSADVVGLPYNPIETARAMPGGGFRVVIDNGGPDELWEVDSMGQATFVGTYPAEPAGYVSSQQDGGPRLDPSGVLYEIRHSLNGLEDVIFRREIGGSAEIVYTEASNPLVKLHISSLLTGP